MYNVTDMSTEKEKDEAIDFDLPDVSEDAPKATKPRIHIGGSTCESCEG